MKLASNVRLAKTLIALLAPLVTSACESPLSVTPSTGLVHGQEVTITARGMTPGTIVSVQQCHAEMLAQTNDIERSCAHRDSASANQDGTATFRLAVSISFLSASPYRYAYSCHLGGCVLSVRTRPDDPGTLVPIEFRPVDQSQRALSVEPLGTLADLQPVAVGGTGLYPNTYLRIGQCRTNPAVLNRDCIVYPFDSRLTEWALTDSAGRFSVSAQPRHTVDPPEADPFTCEAASSCVLFAAPSHGDTVVLDEAAFAPVSFYPPSPPQRGQIAVQSTPIVVGDELQLTGSDFAPYSALVAQFCSSWDEVDFGRVCPRQRNIVADQNGYFAVQLPAPGFFQLFTAGIGQIMADCSRAPGACMVRVWDQRDEARTQVNLPLTMLPAPRTSEMAPNRPLNDGARVKFSGAGWLANSTVSAWLCASLNGDGIAWCSGRGSAISDGIGNFSLSTTVPATFTFAAFSIGTIDCRTTASTSAYTGNPCEWLFSDATGATSAIPLNFVAIQ